MAELLTDMLVCGSCDAPLATSSAPPRRYLCAVGDRPDCALVCCPVDQLDELIMRLAQQRLEHAGLIITSSDPWRTATTQQRRELITGLVASVTLRPSHAAATGQLDPAAVLITWGA